MITPLSKSLAEQLLHKFRANPRLEGTASASITPEWVQQEAGELFQRSESGHLDYIAEPASFGQRVVSDFEPTAGPSGERGVVERTTFGTDESDQNYRIGCALESDTHIHTLGIIANQGRVTMQAKHLDKATQQAVMEMGNITMDAGFNLAPFGLRADVGM